MDMLSTTYFLFLGSTIAAQRMLPPGWRPKVLLCASLFFYGATGPISLTAVLIICILNHLALRMLRDHEATRHRLTIVVVITTINLAILLSAKYLGVFAHLQARIVGPEMSHNPATVMVPLGISYLSFQMIAVTWDAYRGQWELPRSSLLHFFLFGLFFPQITSGPIPRAKDLFPQLQVSAKATLEEIGAGAKLVCYGLYKKFVVANQLNEYISASFTLHSGSEGGLIALPTLIACVYNVVDLYADFSGYVDIARGSALLLGVKLPSNFNHPFQSQSITEVWRRWHMTLSFWFRDYLFIPLLARIGELGDRAVVAALMITFGLAGVWHGLTLPFLCFGLSQGLLMSLEFIFKRHTSQPLRRIPARFAHLIAWVYTMTMLVLSEIFFRAPTLATAEDIFSRLLQWMPRGDYACLKAIEDRRFLITVLATGSWLAVSRVFHRHSRLSTFAFFVFTGVLIVLLGRFDNHSFIYAGF